MMLMLVMIIFLLRATDAIPLYTNVSWSYPQGLAAAAARAEGEVERAEGAVP